MQGSYKNCSSLIIDKFKAKHESFSAWDKVIQNGPSKICGR